MEALNLSLGRDGYNRTSIASPCPHALPGRIETASTQRDPQLTATPRPSWAHAMRPYGPIRASRLCLESGGRHSPLACLLARAPRWGVQRSVAPLRFLSFPMIGGQRRLKHLARSSQGLEGTSHRVKEQPLLMLYLSPAFAAAGIRDTNTTRLTRPREQE